MNKKDLALVAVIGVAVGLLVQPVIFNLVKGSPFLAGLLGGELSVGGRVVVFAGFTILAPLALAVAHFLGKFLPVLYQFAKFAAVGTLNTFINFGLLNLQSLIFGVTSGPLIPVFATVSFLGATTNSFFWNKFWTFGSKTGPGAGEAAKFYLISVGGWLINVGVVSFVVNYIPHLSISPEVWLNIGGLSGVAASFLWNFLGYKFFVFSPSNKS